ncbi:MAG: cyclic nucleotide-binding domain-containing protein [Enhygromyxa sp.]
MQPPKADTELVLAELAQLPIGETLGRDHLARLAQIGSIERFSAATCLFREGEPALDLRLIVSGRVSLTLEVPGRAPMIVASLSRGDLLGWSALQGWAGPSTWSASAMSSKASVCLRFPGAGLRELCEADHELGFCLMRHAFGVVGRRLRDCRVQLLDLYGDGG